MCLSLAVTGWASCALQTSSLATEPEARSYCVQSWAPTTCLILALNKYGFVLMMGAGETTLSFLQTLRHGRAWGFCEIPTLTKKRRHIQ